MVALTALMLGSMPLSAQVDISNPQRLMFVADAEDPVIDVIDLVENEVVFRIETEERVDAMVATPFAPVLIYTNMEKRLVSMYDLREQKVAKQVELPIVPRHMVLDTTGSKIGFSDSESGGFVLFSAYGGQIFFTPGRPSSHLRRSVRSQRGRYLVQQQPGWNHRVDRQQCTTDL